MWSIFVGDVGNGDKSGCRQAGRQAGREEVGGTDGCLLSHAKETDTGAGYLRAILSR